MRDEGVPKSHDISGEGGRGGVCDFAGYLVGSKRVAYLYLVLCCYGGSVELCSTLPYFPFSFFFLFSNDPCMLFL
jgi:hypothetical protein